MTTLQGRLPGENVERPVILSVSETRTFLRFLFIQSPIILLGIWISTRYCDESKRGSRVYSLQRPGIGCLAAGGFGCDLHAGHGLMNVVCRR